MISIKNVLMLDGKRRDILIKGNIIEKIGRVSEKKDLVIEGKNMAAMPGLVNMHTHAAMTLFRGFADDMEFYKAWPERIWPAEARLSGRDVYAGTRLACLEMLRSGTTCFSDHYFFGGDIAKASRSMGMRAVVAELFIDGKSVSAGSVDEKAVLKNLENIKKEGGNLVTPAMGPHSVYTVSREHLSWINDFSLKRNLLVHMHLAETRKENEDCVLKYGKRPVEVLNGMKFLNRNLSIAHAVWLTKGEIRVLAKNNVTVIHNPVSNMKLATGGVMHYSEMKKAGVNVTLGTDGCASNNNLDMFESMKIAALLQKSHLWDQTVLPAKEALEMATINAGRALGLKIGELREGMLADIILINLKRPELTPNLNLASNLVYSANGNCVDTVICDGKIVMQGRKVKGEEGIIEEAERTAERLHEKSGGG